MGGRVAYASPMADITNAQIAAALDELGDLYELDGAVSYRVIAYRNAAKAVRESSVSVIGLSRQGRVTDVPGIGKTLEEKLRALDETGEIPAAVKLRAKFPVGLIVGHAPARLRPQARAAAVRRARDRLAGRAARRRRGGEDPRAARLRRQGGGAAQAGAGRARGGRRSGAARPALEGDRHRRAGARGPARAARAPTASRSPARCGAGPTRSRTSTSSRRRASRRRWPPRSATSSSSSPSSPPARRARA